MTISVIRAVLSGPVTGVGLGPTVDYYTFAYLLLPI